MNPIKILIIGHCHPQTAHVCGLRTKGFAEALSRRDHEVVLLTEALPDTISMPPVDKVAEELSQPGNCQPLVLGCRPQGHRWSRRARSGQLPLIVNKAVLAGSFLVSGGPFADWVSGSRPYFPVLADQWRPDVVWATFGNTGAWLIAQQIARRAGCSWVMDMKDPWTDFIPVPMRRLLVNRFRDAAAATALADVLGDDLHKWFGIEPTTVPSGVDFSATCATTQPTDNDEFRISLVGSLYHETDLRTLMAGIRAWAEERDGQSKRRAILEYFGGETDRFSDATKDLSGVCEIRTRGFVTPVELQQQLRTSRVNAFVNARSGFRHKILEFAVAGRPILCLPAVGADESTIVQQAGGMLHDCSTAGEIKRALDGIDGEINPDLATSVDIERFSWDARAAQLERVFERVLS